MGGEHSRRRFLSAAGAVGITPLVARGSTALDGRKKTLVIESNGGGPAAYEFTVNGSLVQEDSGDEVAGRRAYGHVGPKRGTDTFAYTGKITGFVLAGPATAYRDDNRIQPSHFPHPEGSLTCGDFAPVSGTNVLRIESDGGGIAAYEFEVTGSLAQRDSGDEVTDRRAYGHVGPTRGADEFEFSGDVLRFDLAGPASVFLNGSKVTASSGTGTDDRGLVRAAPASEVTAISDSIVLFEAVAPDHSGEYLRADWYVDGEERVGPGAFYGHMNGRGRLASTFRFEETDTHAVRLEAYEKNESGGRGDHVGTLRWTIEVGPDGNRPPSVELVSPDQPISVAQDSPERRTFEVAVSDPEGDLDRVVWWIGQCDDVVAVSNVAGESDTARISFAPKWGCPLAVRAIDAGGLVTKLYGWDVE